MPRKPGIGQAELEILKYVADHHPATVRQVAQHFARTKGHVRTTVLNVMVRLCRKGYLVRRKFEGIYVYSPRLPQPALLRTLVHDFVQRALGGSVSPFVAYLAEDATLSDDEVRQLRTIVRDLDRAEDKERP